MVSQGSSIQRCYQVWCSTSHVPPDSSVCTVSSSSPATGVTFISPRPAHKGGTSDQSPGPGSPLNAGERGSDTVQQMAVRVSPEPRNPVSEPDLTL